MCISDILKQIHFLEKLNAIDYYYAKHDNWPFTREQKLAQLYDELRFACEAMEERKVA